MEKEDKIEITKNVLLSLRNFGYTLILGAIIFGVGIYIDDPETSNRFIIDHSQMLFIFILGLMGGKQIK